MNEGLETIKNSFSGFGIYIVITILIILLVYFLMKWEIIKWRILKKV